MTTSPAPVHRIQLRLRELAQLFNLMLQGRTSLVIGLAFLALCLIAADVIGALAGGTSLSIVKESLTIAGWVAMWRPLEIFLYDWWPVKRRQRIFLKLSRAHVRVLQGG